MQLQQTPQPQPLHRPLSLQHPLQTQTEARRSKGGTTNAPKFRGAGSGGGLATAFQKTSGLFGALPPNAMSQFNRDLLGVWAPKIPLTRSGTQFFEDAFLENVENFAFYFAVPMLGPLFTKGLNKLHGAGVNVDKVGTAFSELSKDVLKDKQFLGIRAGAMVSALTLAAGVEYMIQHTKNVITAKGFGTKNFAAVAGLEERKNTAQKGEMDPVVKAKRRAKQVGAFMLGGFALAAALPKLVRFKPVANLAEKTLHYFSFGSNHKKGVHFDLTKPVLAALAFIGAASYIDAARDSLERKETGFRLLMVIPYMLFGKELVGNALAKWFENSNIDVEEGGKIIPKKVSQVLQDCGLDGSFLKSDGLKPGDGGLLGRLKQCWNQGTTSDSLLNINLVKDSLADELDSVGKALTPKVKEAIIQKHYNIGIASSILSALLCGIGINVIAYKWTKKRHDLQEQQRQAELRQQQLQQGTAQHKPSASTFPVHAGFSGQRMQSPFAYAGYPSRTAVSRPVATYPVKTATAFNSPAAYAWRPQGQPLR